MMGPILMLDKSTFHGMSYDEHSRMNLAFKPVLPPVLAFEIVADLIKRPTKQRSATESVRLLASKFSGSGPTVCVDYRTACIGSLTGNRIAMTGQIPVAHGVRQDLPDGGYGVMIPPHPLNHALMRWAQGSFLELEEQFAERWKKEGTEVRPDRFRQRLHNEKVISRRASSASELRRVVDAVLDTPAYQRIWLHWILDELAAPSDVRRRVIARWEFLGRPFLRDYALYAAHCVRCMLALDIATQSGLLTWDKHHRLDLQYLFYQPFCMVFASNDKLHKLLSPALMRDNQTFVPGEELKRELQAMHEANVRLGGTLPELVDRISPVAPLVARLWNDHLLGDKRIKSADSME